jgi:transposase
MIYVGIDVAKDKHDCHIFDSDGVVWHDNFSFPNSKDGFERLLAAIAGCAPKTKQEVKIGLEDTGHYSTNLLAFLVEQGFSVVRFNPLSVNRSRIAGTLRKTKTDKGDARYIAALLVAGTTKASTMPDETIAALKSLTRARYRLIKEIQPLKNRYRRLLHLAFPEIQGFFSKTYIPTALNLFAVLPGAQAVADCDVRKLTSLLKAFSHGRHGRSSADKLKALAKNSIAHRNDGDAYELSLMAQRILFLEKQLDTLETEIAKVMQILDSPITSIPGIGTVLGAVILAEIGNIHAFATPAKLLAFAGCEPSTYQSGKYTAAKTPMVKRGSKYLRNALYLAATMTYLHSTSFRAYIDKKRAEGKHFYTAMSHGMKKLSRIIFAVLSKNTPFSETL